MLVLQATAVPGWSGFSGSMFTWQIVEPPKVGLQRLLEGCVLLHEEVVWLELHQQLTQLPQVILLT